MIADFIINVLYNAFMFVLGGFQPFHFNFDATILQTFSDFLAFIFYILPISGLLPIVVIIISLMGFRIIISIIKTIWDLIPLL